MKKLILWDVDATLLLTDGISGQAMRAAMAEVFGPVPRKERTFFSGKTDWQIIRDTFPHISPEHIEEQLPTFSATYIAGFQQQHAALQQRSRLMPGVMDLIQRLHQHQQTVVQAPLTGNIAPIARLKLELFGLLPYLNTSAGAYGDDHYERTTLVPIAANRATQHYGHTFTGNAIVVIGDTPNDIRCGKLNGARTIAVATGPYSVADLQAHQPDAMFQDLSDIEAALAAILMF